MDAVRAPAPASVAAPAPSPMPVFALTNSTNGTNATEPPTFTKHLSMALKLDNLDYDLLASSWPLVSAFTASVKKAIGLTADVPESNAKIALYPGSVVIEAKIKPPNATVDPAAVASLLDGNICSEVIAQLNPLVTMTGLVKGSFNCTQLDLEQEDPLVTPFVDNQTNRPWIAFWSIVLAPPTTKAQDDAWRFVQKMDEPGSCLSHLLPQTLARIPGLLYRGLQQPNAAINSTQVVRLPPPNEKALGPLKTPNPYDRKAEEAWNKKRVEQEAEAAETKAKTQEAVDLSMSLSAAKEANETQAVMKDTEAVIIRAAKLHAEAARPTSAKRGPDIIPFDVDECDHELGAANGGSASPYPRMDQSPPADYWTSVDLLQDLQDPLSARLCG